MQLTYRHQSVSRVMQIYHIWGQLFVFSSMLLVVFLIGSVLE